MDTCRTPLHSKIPWVQCNLCLSIFGGLFDPLWQCLCSRDFCVQLKGLKTYDFGFWLNLISTAQWISAHWSFTRCRHSSTIGCAFTWISHYLQWTGLNHIRYLSQDDCLLEIGVPTMHGSWSCASAHVCIQCSAPGVALNIAYSSTSLNILFAMVYMAQFCVVCLVSFSLVLCTCFVSHFAMKKLKSIILGNSPKTNWWILLLSLHLRTM